MSIQRMAFGVLGGVVGFFLVAISMIYLPHSLELRLGRAVMAYSLFALAIALLIVFGATKLWGENSSNPEAILGAPDAQQMFATFVILGMTAGLIAWSWALLRPRIAL